MINVCMFSARAEGAGFDSATALMLISVIGIGNTIGRVALGLITSLTGVDALIFNNVFISLSGILTIFSGCYLSSWYQFSYAASYGLFICKYRKRN